MFALIKVLKPEDAIYPYNTIAAPAKHTLGIDAIKAWSGPMKANAPRVNADVVITATEATLLNPTVAILSP